MDTSELTPKQLRFWNRMKELHQSEEFSQVQSELKEDKPLLGFCNATLIQSAKQGDLETARTLLDAGATLNREYDGETYCDALESAAGEGRLEMVRLLVQRGADLRSINEYGRNAMMSAESCGHDEVAAYLRSLGMIDIEEIRIYDFESAHETILERISDSRGTPSSWHVEVPGDPHVVIRHIPVQSGDGASAGQILFTIGLSDHRLPLDRFKSHYMELLLHLSPDWPLTPDALSKAEWNWPIEWMERIACQLRSADRIFYSQLFMNGAPPQPLGPNTKLCGWVGEAYEGGALTYDVEGGRTVYTLVLFPIYEDEASIIENKGVAEFRTRLCRQSERQGKSSCRIIDPSRSSVAGDSSSLPI